MMRRLRLLQEVRERGAWEPWLDFFLRGIAETANQAFDAATRIVELFKSDRDRMACESDRAGSTLRVHDLFQQHPFLTANLLAELTDLSAPTINAALADLRRLGVLEEVTGRRRGRVLPTPAISRSSMKRLSRCRRLRVTAAARS